MKKTRRPKKPEWYWIEGLRKLNGVKVWVKLYCTRDQSAAELLAKQIAYQVAHPDGNYDAHQKRELDGLVRYREFRVEPQVHPEVRCAKCSSNYLKRIKKGDERLWKCRNCGHRWERSFTEEVQTPSEAPRRVSEARKGSRRGNDTPKASRKAQKASQKPVPKRKKPVSRKG